ncbi:unnamed protein product [Pedinophyceae sp. YPF-701]|nr:unnamed protein product [Pedinophyceae sp. YPF-701]
MYGMWSEDERRERRARIAAGEADGNLETCVLCKQGGNLVCCDFCPGTYHMRCIGETPRALSDERDWKCPECEFGGRDQSAGLRAPRTAIDGDQRSFIIYHGGVLATEQVVDDADSDSDAGDGDVMHRPQRPWEARGYRVGLLDRDFRGFAFLQGSAALSALAKSDARRVRAGRAGGRHLQTVAMVDPQQGKRIVGASAYANRYRNSWVTFAIHLQDHVDQLEKEFRRGSRGRGNAPYIPPPLRPASLPIHRFQYPAPPGRAPAQPVRQPAIKCGLCVHCLNPQHKKPCLERDNLMDVPDDSLAPPEDDGRGINGSPRLSTLIALVMRMERELWGVLGGCWGGFSENNPLRQFRQEPGAGREALARGGEWRREWVRSVRGATTVSHLAAACAQLEAAVPRELLPPAWDIVGLELPDATISACNIDQADPQMLSEMPSGTPRAILFHKMGGMMGAAAGRRVKLQAPDGYTVVHGYRCGYCDCCLNPHWKQACKNRLVKKEEDPPKKSGGSKKRKAPAPPAISFGIPAPGGDRPRSKRLAARQDMAAADMAASTVVEHKPVPAVPPRPSLQTAAEFASEIPPDVLAEAQGDVRRSGRRSRPVEFFRPDDPRKQLGSEPSAQAAAPDRRSEVTLLMDEKDAIVSWKLNGPDGNELLDPPPKGTCGFQFVQRRRSGARAGPALPTLVLRRAARQGGQRMVPGVSYKNRKAEHGLESSPRLQWLARVDQAQTASQLGLLLRELDMAVHWDPVKKPEASAAGVFHFLGILDRRVAEGGGWLEYLVDFEGGGRGLSDAVERLVDDYAGRWVPSYDLPMWFTREFEERARRRASVATERGLDFYEACLTCGKAPGEPVDGGEGGWLCCSSCSRAVHAACAGFPGCDSNYEWCCGECSSERSTRTRVRHVTRALEDGLDKAGAPGERRRVDDIIQEYQGRGEAVVVVGPRRARKDKPSVGAAIQTTLEEVGIHRRERGAADVCVCRSTDRSRAAVTCDVCGELYHADCVGLLSDDVHLVDQYVCQGCTTQLTAFNKPDMVVRLPPKEPRDGCDSRPCTVCQVRGSGPLDVLGEVRTCGHCKVPAHLYCAFNSSSVDPSNPNEWLCDACAAGHEPDQLVCVLCEKSGGLLKRMEANCAAGVIAMRQAAAEKLRNHRESYRSPFAFDPSEVWCHTLCAAWMQASFTGQGEVTGLQDSVEEAAFTYKCRLCGDKGRGALAVCDHVDSDGPRLKFCSVQVHPACAREHGLPMALIPAFGYAAGDAMLARFYCPNHAHSHPAEVKYAGDRMYSTGYLIDVGQDIAALQSASAARSHELARLGPGMRKCLLAVDALLLCPESLIFREPVSRSEAPDYHRVVKCPMDLGTIRKNIVGGAFAATADVARAVRLVFANCRLYNDPGSSFCTVDARLCQVAFERAWATAGLPPEEAAQGQDERLAMVADVKRGGGRGSRAGRKDDAEDWVRSAQSVLGKVLKLKAAWWFTEPVPLDTAPDYLEVVKHPMDLGTVRDKLQAGGLQSPEQVVELVELVWSNCRAYNDADSDVCRDAATCEKAFNKHWTSEGLPGLVTPSPQTAQPGVPATPAPDAQNLNAEAVLANPAVPAAHASLPPAPQAAAPSREATVAAGPAPPIGNPSTPLAPPAQPPQPAQPAPEPVPAVVQQAQDASLTVSQRVTWALGQAMLSPLGWAFTQGPAQATGDSHVPNLGTMRLGAETGKYGVMTAPDGQPAEDTLRRVLADLWKLAERADAPGGVPAARKVAAEALKAWSAAGLPCLGAAELDLMRSA